MIHSKTQHQPSPMSEATLWRLYRRLLSEQLLVQQLERAHHLERAHSERAHLEKAARQNSRHAAGGARYGQGWGIAAALSENLLAGDTLGLAADDLVARYLCGVPLDKVREAAQSPPPRRRAGREAAIGWPHAADAEHGLLPGTGEEQASLALGTALAARLHRSGRITVLVAGCTASPSAKAPRKPRDPNGWVQAAQTAVALQLPLLLVSHAPFPGREAPRPPFSARRSAHSLPSIPVDRDDALALYRVIYESAARARSGGGPTWIECRAWELAPAARRTPLLDQPSAEPVIAPGTAMGPARETALEKMEQALRARRLFNSQQQRHLQHALEKEFAQAGWPPSSRP